jgi:hypothetical protein
MRAAASQVEDLHCPNHRALYHPIFHHYRFTVIDTPLVTAVYYHRAAERAMSVPPEAEQSTRALQHYTLIRFLISQGADVNCASRSDLSPLCFSVIVNSDIKLVRMSLENGADPCAKDPLGTPLGHILFGSIFLAHTRP